MANIFPIDFEEKLTMAQDDYILFSDSEDGNKIKKAQYKNLKGEKGDPGTPGADGSAATITVGSVSTGAAGSSATVVNSGTSSAAVLDFTIPQGVAGTPGVDGNDGAAATITVGTTTTLSPGSSATVTNVGTSSAAVLNFGIPKGDSGTGSGDVSGPASSTDGDVAIFDGATGKLIKDGSVALSTLSAGASAGSTAVQPGDIGTAAACNTGTSSGNVPILDSNGKLATSTLPGVALTDTFTVSTSADLTTLSSADQGDIAIVTSENKTYVLSVAPYSTAANWKEILAPTGGVTSVNGQTGAVTVPEFTASNGGTKVFTYPTTSVEDIVTWCNGGGTAILMKSDGPYVVSKVGTNYIVNVRDSSGDGGTLGNGSVIADLITFNSGTYAVTSSNNTRTYNHIRYSNLTVTLTSAGWSSNTQTVSATGVTASNTVFISPSPSNYSDYTDAEIYCSAQGSGTLTFTCGTEPTSNITVNVFLIK